MASTAVLVAIFTSARTPRDASQLPSTVLALSALVARHPGGIGLRRVDHAAAGFVEFVQHGEARGLVGVQPNTLPPRHRRMPPMDGCPVMRIAP